MKRVKRIFARITNALARNLLMRTGFGRKKYRNGDLCLMVKWTESEENESDQFREPQTTHRFSVVVGEH